LPALFCAICFAVASSVGADIAWGVLAAAAPRGVHLPDGRIIAAGSFLLALAKSLGAFAVSGREAMDQARLDTAEEAKRDHDDAEQQAERDRRHRLEELKLQHRHEERMRQGAKSSGDPHGQALNTFANGSPRRSQRNRNRNEVGGGPGAGGENKAKASAQNKATQGNAGETSPALPTSEDRERAKLLLAEGWTPKKVHEATGVPHGTCKRYAHEGRQANGS
jgi:hypothetical protein